MLYSARSGVKRVHVALSALRIFQVCHCVLMLFVDCGVGISDEFENCVWDVCLTFDVISRKITSRPWHVVKLRPNTGMS